jgi:tRNA A-37 threonylcarbamoyl transferase component Bud32
MSAEKDNLIGKMVEGRYLIESQLGAGGMGAVYIARDLRVLGRTVVVKVLLQESFENQYVVKKFRQEAEALSRVDHPNIVQIMDYGEMDDHHPFLVLQFIDGVNLRTILRPGGVELDRMASLIRQVAYALTAAHEKGILHRDLKPENIMLQMRDGEERAVVIDFGIAQLQNSVIAPKTIVTATAGTIAYMSPEQLSAGSLTTASDTYALGIIAYELLTGQKPFNPKSPFQLLEMQREGLKVMPRSLRADVPEEVERVIVRALAFEPENRYQATRDFGNELCWAVSGNQGGDSVGKTGHSDHRTANNVNAIGTDFGTNRATNGGSGQAATKMYADPVHGTQGGGQLAPTVITDPNAVPVPLPVKKKRLLPAILVILLVILVGVVGFELWRFFRDGQNVVKPKPSPSPVVTPTQQEVVTQNNIGITYSLTVQKVRDKKLFEAPFESSGREIFEKEWRFNLNIATAKAGYLYLINEGRDDRGTTVYTLLFPTDKNAQIAAQQTVQIPKAPQYYVFAGQTGTEMNWMIWSEKPVPELEALTDLMNPKNQGLVSNPEQVNSVRSFLTSHQAKDAVVSIDKGTKRTNVTAKGDMLVYLSELEHH